MGKEKNWLLIEFGDEIRGFTRHETEEDAQQLMRYNILHRVGTEAFVKVYMKNGDTYDVGQWGLDDDSAWIRGCSTIDGRSYRNWQIIDIG